MAAISSKANGIEVIPVNRRKLLNEFMDFPYRLYRNNPSWVAPLRSEERKNLDPRTNHFLRDNPVQLFLCRRKGRVVGRIAGIINLKHQEIYGDNAAFFGCYEAENDLQVSRKLLTAAEEWTRKRGAEKMRGPTYFSINSISGLFVGGSEEPPFIMMPYNPLYYENQLESAGFRKVMKFLAYEVDDRTIRIPSIIGRLEEKMAQQGITFRYPDFSNLAREAEIVEYLFNNAWSENWGFLPTNRNEVLEQFIKVKPFARNNLIIIAESKGEPVGFSLSLPDINQALKPLKGRLLPFNWLKLLRNLKKIRQIRVLLMGVMKEFRNRGVDLVFYKKTMENAVAMNYRRAELSWILESNVQMNRVLRHINARPYKTYCMMEKTLD